MSADPIAPLTREEVVQAVERKRPRRIPLVRARWWGEGFEELHGEQLRRFDRFPEDVVLHTIDMCNPHKMGLSWELPSGGAHDAMAVIDDWAKLDEFIEKLPDPENDPQFETVIEVCKQARQNDRYFIFGWWRLFFERPWGLRGMQNLMIDYYESPDLVRKLHSALCDQYLAYLRRAIRDCRPDGFWCSDDLGHQTGPMMSPATFHEQIFPHYARLGQVLRANGIHWWLHSCGDNSALMDDLIAAGVNMFHPVQKGTMDERETMTRFGGRLGFLAGIDVQHTLQEKDPDGVREEVRFLIDTFDGPGGGMAIAAGNGILPGTPLENVEAYLDEAIRYGTEHRQKLNG